MTGNLVLLVIQPEVEDAIMCPPHEYVPSVHVSVLKLQCLWQYNGAVKIVLKKHPY